MPPGRGVARRTKDVSTMRSPHPLPIMDDLLYESDTRSGERSTVDVACLDLRDILEILLPTAFCCGVFVFSGGLEGEGPQWLSLNI